jgi:hypothetical protein
MIESFAFLYAWFPGVLGILILLATVFLMVKFLGTMGLIIVAWFLPKKNRSAFIRRFL